MSLVFGLVIVYLLTQAETKWPCVTTITLIASHSWDSLGEPRLAHVATVRTRLIY